MSIYHPGQPSAFLGLCALAPLGKKEAILPATSVCPGPLVPEAGGGGAEGGGVGAPVPRLVGGGGVWEVLRTGEGGQWEGINYCPVKE